LPLVTLLTDFGTADGYVAEMKGVILSIAPQAQLVDASHDIPAHDVEMARLTLARYWRRFPQGTVHVVVVDPGVGSSRAALAVESDGWKLVGADNGVLSPALLVAGARAVGLPVPATAAPTFHGRDVFAPAAAQLASGASLDSLGSVQLDPMVRRTPEPVREPDGSIRGEIIAIDRFGNLVTNLAGLRLGVLMVRGQVVPVLRTYSDVPSGKALALIGSSGLLEIAVRDGSADVALGAERGVEVHWSASG
jgi:S-adenosylmethionine hydrolase